MTVHDCQDLKSINQGRRLEGKSRQGGREGAQRVGRVKEETFLCTKYAQHFSKPEVDLHSD